MSSARENQPKAPVSEKRKWGLIAAGVGLITLFGFCGCCGIFVVLGGMGVIAVPGGGMGVVPVPFSKVSRANVDKIEIGMTVKQVESILGKASTAAEAGQLETRVWQNGKAAATVGFRNGEVYHKQYTDDFVDDAAKAIDLINKMQNK